jgi:hypothetical protein
VGGLSQVGHERSSSAHSVPASLEGASQRDPYSGQVTVIHMEASEKKQKPFLQPCTSLLCQHLFQASGTEPSHSDKESEGLSGQETHKLTAGDTQLGPGCSSRSTPQCIPYHWHPVLSGQCCTILGQTWKTLHDCQVGGTSKGLSPRPRRSFALQPWEPEWQNWVRAQRPSGRVTAGVPFSSLGGMYGAGAQWSVPGEGARTMLRKHHTPPQPPPPTRTG